MRSSAHTVPLREFTHPIQVTTALLDRRVEVHVRQFLAKGPNVKAPPDLAEAGEFLLRPRAAAPYSGGICFTMTPKLNQLSLFEAAQSFRDPEADPSRLTEDFFVRLFADLTAPSPDYDALK